MLLLWVYIAYSSITITEIRIEHILKTRLTSHTEFLKILLRHSKR